ncbi:type III restriction-modification system endonuclease [Pasteurella multocida]|uniref:type III restriction-modification system endonuclease n=1 Tax=Pasteurella multocida TaxID=747 RepID=UPI002020074B|nr:type III restriction-modification system endonuclease [Pasteurella multocida]MCL7827648.1 type III restriction-modification system endonuclease [Pasteurella multocida]URI04160.1 type III restriction-modification system endonuclease [Pasteurella multocida]HDR1315722.1 type III restriction-modification system endonuclease [Pasteurella multocida]
MAGFHYEKGLLHQLGAVQAVLSAFNQFLPKKNERGENPTISVSAWVENIRQIQHQHSIETTLADGSNVLDIAMETGTGKTYTYTQTMFEMHKQLKVYKFVIAVPTLSIKAGTEQFLTSDALKKHFRLDFEGEYGEAKIELYVVQSQKAKKGKKNQPMPTEIVRFVQADNTKKIHVLLLNMGMINSKTMKGEDAGNDGSVLLKDLYSKPFEAIASVKPILIVDEPHRFDEGNQSWQNLMSLNPQFVLRYGATFKDKFRNLIYRLTAIDAFNQDLVKGVKAFVQEVQGDEKAKVRFVESDGKAAKFELSGSKMLFVLNVGESLEKVHSQIHGLYLDKLNKSTAVLSNGLELKKGDSFNPYSYSNPVFDKMLREAVREHFNNERELLSRLDKIKPLTLFFIDDIAGYREGDKIVGSLKQRFEICVKEEAEKALQTAEPDSAFYHSLQTVLKDISATHGGYFSKDNSSDDEKIAKEISEILHDKESLLSLDNPRRFIFSKWTLREGWDNPNVFGICKLRSSGSETSKLQEVGRGLRLPVNEFMARVKDGNFMLNYFVDSSETDFVQKLTDEVNQSAVKAVIFSSFTDELFEKIKAVYPDVKKRVLGNTFYEKQWIDDDDNFINDGFEQVKKTYPEAFGKADKLKNGKIIHSGKDKTKVKMRVGKYDELKSLWEAINQKAILQYQINEAQCLQLLLVYLQENKGRFIQTGIKTQVSQIKVSNHQLVATTSSSLNDDNFEPIVTMNYRTFLQKLAQKSFIQMATLHSAFHQLRDEIQIEQFMNEYTISTICKGFNRYLLHHSFSEFQVGYEKVRGRVHPTKFTDAQGKPLAEVNAADLGVQSDNATPLDSFLFDSLFFDSEIERQNITDTAIQEVTIFTKIPKNSIKIPVAGGGTYSPDFAYIVKTDQGETLNLVVESKGVEGQQDLRADEQRKIQHAEHWFQSLSGQLKVKFETQFKAQQIKEIILKQLQKSEKRCQEASC